MENKNEKSEVLVSRRTNWTPPMDRYFIKLMVERVNDGQFLDGQFSKIAWKLIADQFKAKFGAKYDLEIIKNHYRAVKKAHSAIRTLLGQSGFGWDEGKEMVIADNDDVWADYIKAHPDFKMWRSKSMAGYEELCKIFGNGGASGKFSRAPEDKDMTNDNSNMNNGEALDGGDFQSPFSAEDLGDDTQVHIDLDDEFESLNLPKRKKSLPPSTRNTKKPRRSTGEGMVDAIHGMASAITQMANKKKESCTLSPTHTLTHEAKLVSALEDIPEIDDMIYNEALDLLEDEKKAKLFVELPTERRRSWLLYKLNRICS